MQFEFFFGEWNCEAHLRKGAEWVLNPLCFACWSDEDSFLCLVLSCLLGPWDLSCLDAERSEDFIGRIARVTRKANRRTEGLRTLQLALLQYARLWKDL